MINGRHGGEATQALLKQGLAAAVCILHVIACVGQLVHQAAARGPPGTLPPIRPEESFQVELVCDVAKCGFASMPEQRCSRPPDWCAGSPPYQQRPQLQHACRCNPTARICCLLKLGDWQSDEMVLFQGRRRHRALGSHSICQPTVRNFVSQRIPNHSGSVKQLVAN